MGQEAKSGKLTVDDRSPHIHRVLEHAKTSFERFEKT
jgi:hypothetical protein